MLKRFNSSEPMICSLPYNYQPPKPKNIVKKQEHLKTTFLVNPNGKNYLIESKLPFEITLYFKHENYPYLIGRISPNSQLNISQTINDFKLIDGNKITVSYDRSKSFEFELINVNTKIILELNELFSP